MDDYKQSNELTLVEKTQQDILKYISKTEKNSTLPKEQEFADYLGVSRVVIREALSRLRALGIIETKRKKGTTVVVPELFCALKSVIEAGLLDKNTLRDLYQLRLMIEIGMADFVFQYKTEEQMNELDQIVAKEVELKTKMNNTDTEEDCLEIAYQLTQVDIQFHSKLFEMTHNKSLMDFQYILRHLFTLYYPKTSKDYHNETLVSHVSLFNILRTGTADSFRMAMRLHLKTQFDNMESILNKTFNEKSARQ